eukprot:UN03593
MSGQYRKAISSFIDEESLKEMLDTLERSGRDHFDPDDPLNTRICSSRGTIWSSWTSNRMRYS